MKNIKAVYDGKQVKLLEPVDLPADTPLEILVKKNHREGSEAKMRGILWGIMQSTWESASLRSSMTIIYMGSPNVAAIHE